MPADFTLTVLAPRRYGAGPGPRNTPHRRRMASMMRTAAATGGRIRENVARMILEASRAR